jgi:16S rRNA A1518/A1519 N6-dimethyltransferase RsmA/KsgA/DIM1 with predicted DNA glycosylase/AP lyase activity
MVGDGDVNGFRRMVVGLFSFRRKQLIRGLRELTGRSPAEVGAWLGTAGIEPSRRPQSLPPEAFVTLYSILQAAGWSAQV